jgi:O-antigen/teichoic acid export membrane protein
MVLWAVQLVLAAGLTPVITRVIRISEFGTVAAATAVMQIVIIVAAAGLPTAIQRQFHLGGDDGGARKVLTATIGAAVVCTGLLLLSEPIWGSSLGFGRDPSALLLSILWAGESAVTMACLALLRSQDRLIAFCLVSLFQSIGAEASSLAFVLAHDPTADAFLTGRVVAQSIAMVLALAAVPPRWIRAADLRLIVGALRYCLPLVPAALSVFVLTTSDRLIVQRLMGNDAVAQYQVAYNVASILIILLAVLQTAWLPRFFDISAEESAAATFADARDMLYRLVGPAVIGFAAGAPLILRIWAPAAYDPQSLSLVVALVVLTTIPCAAQVLLSLRLTTEGRTGALAVASAVAALVNIAMNLLLIPLIGLTGSALATLIAYVAQYAVSALSARRIGRPVRPGTAAVLLLTVAAGVVLASGYLPDRGVAAIGRVAVVLLMLAWFARLLVRFAAPVGRAPAGPAPIGTVPVGPGQDAGAADDPTAVPVPSRTSPRR